MSYLFASVLGVELLVGADVSYTMEYERNALIIAGAEIQEQDDYAGTRGGAAGGIATALPELRGSAFADLTAGGHSVRWTTRYIAGVTGVRPSVPDGFREIGSFLTHDATYRLPLPAQTTVSASVFNLTDRDPPFVRLDSSYDPFIGNPLGRYFKVAVTKRFD